MASAYATIASGGMHYQHTPILRVTDSDGNVLIDNSAPQGERVISEEVAHAAEQVMEGVVNTSEGSGTDARLSSGQIVAGKTGTQENRHDLWFCGITPQLSVACWMGDPLNKESMGHVGMDETFAAFMNVALAGMPNEEFPEADEPEYEPYDDDEFEIYSGPTKAELEAAAAEAERAAQEAAEQEAAEQQQPTTEEPPDAGDAGDDNGGGGGDGGAEGDGGGGTGDGGETVPVEPAA